MSASLSPSTGSVTLSVAQVERLYGINYRIAELLHYGDELLLSCSIWPPIRDADSVLRKQPFVAKFDEFEASLQYMCSVYQAAIFPTQHKDVGPNIPTPHQLPRPSVINSLLK